MTNWETEEGAPNPLGVSWIEHEQAYNFALYSKHADDVSLLLYLENDPERPALTYHLDYLKNKSGSIWHCRIPAGQLRGAKYYAYCIGGPPPGLGHAWHNFDPEKILLDPYAMAVVFPPGFDRRAACGPGANAGHAPVGLIRVDEQTFDLASIFTHNSDGSINLTDPPIFAEISSDPDLARVRLIAEPWEPGQSLLVGQKFPSLRWRLWNSQFRDTVQRFVRGDPGMVTDLMTRLYGSCDLFPDDLAHACRPYQSVNYVTSHDGFTLYDLVAYNRKHNEANGQGNKDGPADFSWNGGWEGDNQVPAETTRLRKRQIKN